MGLEEWSASKLLEVAQVVDVMHWFLDILSLELFVKRAQNFLTSTSIA
jgi:hypothetical protein